MGASSSRRVTPPQEFELAEPAIRLPPETEDQTLWDVRCADLPRLARADRTMAALALGYRPLCDPPGGDRGTARAIQDIAVRLAAGMLLNAMRRSYDQSSPADLVVLRSLGAAAPTQDTPIRLFIYLGESVLLVPLVGEGDDRHFDEMAATAFYQGLSPDDWRRLLDNGATPDGADLLRRVQRSMRDDVGAVLWHLQSAAQWNPLGDVSGLTALLSMRVLAPDENDPMTLVSPLPLDDLWMLLSSRAERSSLFAAFVAPYVRHWSSWAQNWAHWLTDDASLGADDRERNRTLLRALYANADPVRYHAWMKRQRDANSVNAYLDEVDRTFGRGMSSRWVANAVELLGTPESELTLRQRQAIRDLAAYLDAQPVDEARATYAASLFSAATTMAHRRQR